MSQLPFTPSATTQSIAATTTSASATVIANQPCVRVYNVGPSIAFVRFTAGASTALVTDMPVAAGAIELFTKGDADTVSAITASGTATIYLTVGEGV